jgi:GPH family glycoside/pentoside/hexuronide:cation symporter
MAGFAMNWLYWLTQRDIFNGIVDGMRWVGIGCGILLILTSMAPAVLLREPTHAPPPVRPRAGSGTGFVASIRAALSSRPFLLVVAACVSVIVGVLLTMQVGMYLNIYYVAGGNQKFASGIQGLTGSFYQVTSLLTVPLTSWLGTHLGKRKALMGILSLGVIGSLSSWFLITPAAPYLQIVSLFFTAPAIGGLWILAPSMIADVCDYDEDLCGTRREGTFGAAYAWFTKVGSSLAILASGFVLVSTGFDVKYEVAQAAGTILGMRALNALVPATFFALAVLCVYEYPISEKVAGEIRRRLEAGTTAT